MSEIATWLTALVTLAIYSFLYRDNPFYKAAEYLLVGLSLGYALVIALKTVLWPGLILPLAEGKLTSIIPLILGSFMLARLAKGLRQFSQVSFALYVGAGAGISIPAMLKARVLQQMAATVSPANTISGIIMIVGVCSTLLYFYFSRSQRGMLKPVSKIGMYYMMIFFGATFGYTVMSRVSLLIGRMEFLLGDWLGLIGS